MACGALGTAAPCPLLPSALHPCDPVIRGLIHPIRGRRRSCGPHHPHRGPLANELPEVRGMGSKCLKQGSLGGIIPL